MSKYTTEVRFICEAYAQLDKSEGYQGINNIIEKARDKVFNFDFPIYDENYRSVLETKILKHYYTREIGFETVGLWEHFLDMKMNEIMPYYNELYKSAALDFNPLNDVDITTTSNRGIDKTENTSENKTRTDNLTETNTNNNTRTDNLSSKYDDTSGTNYGHVIDTENSDSVDSSDRYSETPQGSLTGLTELQYLTNARMKTDSTNGTGKETHSGLDTEYDNSTTTNTGTQKNEGGYTNNNTGTQKNDSTGNKKINSTDEYLEHIAGKRGSKSFSEMLTEYRKTFLNIDLMIINDLSDLFMGVW